MTQHIQPLLKRNERRWHIHRRKTSRNKWSPFRSALGFSLKDRYGKPVDSSLNEKLGLVSIGISVRRILREYKRVDAIKATHSEIECRKPKEVDLLKSR